MMSKTLKRVHLGRDSTQLNSVLFDPANAHLSGSMESATRFHIIFEQRVFKLTLLLLQMRNVRVLLGKG